jgi:hypothetical protein
MESLERYLKCLGAQDWAGIGTCVAEDLERTGPFLDVIRGRKAYVEFLAGAVSALENYELKVSRVRAVAGGSALVELSEIMDQDGRRTEHPEVLLFDFDAAGLIRRIDIYIKRVPAAPGP